MCGPTVYDSSHLGHARSYVSFDIVTRILCDYMHRTCHVAVGMTDVDDKIIARAAERGIHYAQLARVYENEFVHDMARLNVSATRVQADAGVRAHGCLLR